MLLYVAVFGGLIALWGFAIVDAARVPGRVWTDTGRNKAAWLLVLVVLPVGGVVVYLALVRRDVHGAWAHLRTTTRRAPVPPNPATGIKTCPSCGFASNPAAITRCRHCGEPF